MRVLCVAEKPSVAKSVASILASNHSRSRDSPVRYIKNYDFQYRLPGIPEWVDFTMTSVAGHLTETDFEQQYRSWQSCDPFALFEAPIKREVSKDHKGTERNLLNEARNADRLMIWTDCDREGEHIGSEIVTVCRRVKPNIVVQRARFSAIIPNQIHHACKNPVELDWKQAAAVEARIDLDLRIGSAFTRTQTLGLKAVHPDLEEMLISYGPCQFPCLGFVVDRYEKILAFVPESFWYIHVTFEKDGCEVSFNWNRVRLFDRETVKTIVELLEEDPEAEVVEVKNKSTKKFKPLPLTTVELQKAGSRLLHLAPKRILDIAESLYQKGYVSYPRTETDQFDPQFNFMELIEKQTVDGAWGAFATTLKDGGFARPRNGNKNDKAHPPIHPTAHVNNLTGDDKRVYEFITRRYLACCSKDAVGNETIVDISIAGEGFTAKGLIVLERNYLDVYPYDTWQGNQLPQFAQGETFIPDICEMKHGRTTKPSLLTEADLVALMDQNGIGTDATIGEHIAKILERMYVMKHKEGRMEYLSPSTLGIGLVKGYNQVGLDKSLSKPQLRRETELRMVQVCEGTKTKTEMIQESLEEYKEVFIKAKRGFNTIANEVLRYLQGRGSGQVGADRNMDGDGGGGDVGGGGGGGGGEGGRGGRGGGGRKNNNQFNNQDSDDGRPKGKKSLRRAPQPDPTNTASTSQQDINSNKISFSDLPACSCGLPSVERTVVKEGPNKGRVFYRCSKREGGCSYFHWADGIGSNKRANDGQDEGSNKRLRTMDHGSEVRCSCGLEAILLTVTKEGPNMGRQFYKCSKVSNAVKCSFFQWMDELSGSTSGPSRSNGRTTIGECFNCGQEGHWTKDCPDPKKSNGRRNDDFSTKRGGTGRGRGRGRGRKKGYT